MSLSQLLKCATVVQKQAQIICNKQDYSNEIFFFVFFAFSRATSAAHGGSQARGPTEAVAASLCQNHSNAGSEPCLQPTPHLTATPDPQRTEQGQGSNPQPHGS